MFKISSKVQIRLSNGIKQFQSVLESAKSRDVNESDTVIIVTDMLYYIFGYDKYSEITSEFSIRGTYCDLATKINGKPNLLIEVKAIGLDLKDTHTKQAIDYASNQGVDWVILTNGIKWIVYKVIYSKPINQDVVYEIDFLSLNYKKQKDVDLLYPISKEGYSDSSLHDFHSQKQTVNRFFLGAAILSQPILNAFKKELKKVSAAIKVEDEELIEILKYEVIKREIIESENFTEATRKLTRIAYKIEKDKKSRSNSEAQAPDTEETVENSDNNS